MRVHKDAQNSAKKKKKEEKAISMELNKLENEAFWSESWERGCGTYHYIKLKIGCTWLR